MKTMNLKFLLATCIALLNKSVTFKDQTNLKINVPLSLGVEGVTFTVRSMLGEAHCVVLLVSPIVLHPQLVGLDLCIQTTSSSVAYTHIHTRATNLEAMLSYTLVSH